MPTSARHPCTNSIKEDITLSQYEKEINRRRTFAIISHPDAGKTTLTEKFLYRCYAVQYCFYAAAAT